jgi:asparagine synthase (glutamine-hydrolysing)
MANFVLVVDPDPARRKGYLDRIAPQLPPLPGLTAGHRQVGDCAVAWAAGPRAPLSVAADDGGLAVLFGDALLGPDGTPLDAPALRAHWHHPGREPAAAPVLDGYHAGLAYVPGRGVTVGVDLMGWFPLYWFARGNVLAVASSPELLRQHPLCAPAVDPAALAGILMLNGLLTPPALLSPLRRPPPGHLLCWSPAGGAREREQYALPTEWAGEDLPWHAYVERIDAAIADAVRRHVGKAPRVGILLSGGLDSRMLAGYATEQGTELTALTQGIASDVEMRCAVGAARALGVPHRAYEIPPAALPAHAALAARWEHLAGGFSWVLSWGQGEGLCALPERVVAGYAFDHLLHANTKTAPEALRTGTLPFPTAFATRNADALAPAHLRRLLAPTAGAEVVDDVLADMARIYAGYAGADFRRYWRFSLTDRVRNHIGAISWRGCFTAWPVLPALDHALLDAIGSLPVAAMSGRRLQREIVRRRFPRLAALPLDHNSLEDTPVAPPLAYQLRRAARERVTRLPLLRTLAARRRESRFYVRTFTIRGDGWERVRQAAAPHLARLDVLMDPDLLADFLPPPGTPIRLGADRPRQGGLKLLLGLALWSEGRL